MPLKPRKLVVLASLLLTVSSSSGCAVLRAASGGRHTELSALYTGQDRAVLLKRLGEPKKTVVLDGKKRDVFLLRAENAPSAGRALGHAAMDFFTTGAWELIGAGIEDGRSRASLLTVEYDEHDKVADAYPGDVGSKRE